LKGITYNKVSLIVLTESMSYGSVKRMYYTVELRFRSITLKVYAEMHTRFDGKRGLPPTPDDTPRRIGQAGLALLRQPFLHKTILTRSTKGL